MDRDTADKLERPAAGELVRTDEADGQIGWIDSEPRLRKVSDAADRDRAVSGLM